MVERRSNPRKNYKVQVLLRLNEIIKGYGYTKDISIGGVCINTHELFSLLGQTIEDRILNKTLEINFLSETLTLKGTIIHVKTFEEELIVSISQVSNPTRWISLCR